jgi:two-component system sensor histidine kinase UhpB
MERLTTRLFWRVFLLDASLLTLIAVLLVVTPVTISTPIALTEAAIVVVGLLLFLGLNAVLLRSAFRPLERLVHRMDAVDLLRPGQRLPMERRDEIGQVVRAFNRMLDRLEAERRESGRRQLEAQEAERRAIARDLHDEVGQLLTGVLLQLRQPQEVAEPTQPELGDARAAVRRALDEVRRISRELRPEMLEALGLVSALSELTISFERVTGVRVEQRIPHKLPELDASTELAIYRIVQECLTNVARHAQATRVGIGLEVEADSVVIEVEDDGIGITEPIADGGGLRSMRERAVLIGAALAVTSAPATSR